MNKFATRTAGWSGKASTPVLRAVGPDETTRHGDARTRALAGYARIGDRSAQIEDEARKVDPVYGGSEADERCLCGVVAEFEFVRRAIRQDALQVDDGVGRIGRRVDHLSGDVVRLIASALIPEHTNIAGPPVAQAEIQPRAERILADVLSALQLRDIEVRIRRLSFQEDRARRRKART